MSNDKAGLIAEIVADTDLVLDPRVDEARFRLSGKAIGAVLPFAVEALRRRMTGEDKPILLPNWPNFAATMGGGLWPGLHVLTGGTGTGKSQFALQLALQAARGGVPTQYIGLELDDLGLVARLLCMAAGDGAGIWWSSLYTGNGVQGDATLRRLEQAYSSELSSLPMYLSTEHGAGGWSYEQIGYAVEDLRLAHPEANGRPVLLVVDFLQLLGGSADSREDIRERIGKAAYGARQAARKYNAVILALSSTAREKYPQLALELNPNGEPKTPPIDLIGMGKESGDIEYAADSALVMARAKDDDPGAVWIAAAKLRAGSSKWCRLVEDRGWFSEGERQGPSNPGKPKKAPAVAKVPASGGKVDGRSRAAGGGDDLL